MKRFGIMLMAKKDDAPDGGGGKGAGKGKAATVVETPPEADENEEEEEETEEESEEEAEETDESEEETEEEEEEESEFDEDDLALLRQLKDPSKRARALRKLAKEAQEETPKGTPTGKVKGSWKKALSDSLGKDFANALVPLLEEAISESVDDVRNALTSTERNRITAEANRAEKQFYTDYPEARKAEKRIMAIMSKYAPDPGADPYDYMVDMYKLVSKDTPKKINSPEDARRSERIKKNKQEQGRPASGKAPGSEPTRGVKGNLSLKEAVALAKAGKQVK